ncbi:hypothetical protein [Hoeflea marina]|nr:hypothetical protein [Hoeflea marina]
MRGLKRALDRLEGCGIERKSAPGKVSASARAASRTAPSGAPADLPGATDTPEMSESRGTPDMSWTSPTSDTPEMSGTSAMLRRMRAVLARELDRFCGADAGPGEAAAGEAGGKAAVDLMSLIVRTLEKIDLLERTLAAGESDAAPREMGPDEREALRGRVRGIVERLARERLAELVAAGAAPVLPPCGGDVTEGDRGG